MANFALQSGDKGTLVLWLQDALNKVHGSDLQLDGDYGPITVGTVEEFQAAQGLGVDGKAGRDTFERIGLDFGSIRKNGSLKNVSWLLPSAGSGFVTYNRDGNDQFGTEDTISRMMNYFQEFHASTGRMVEAGNISRFCGGRHRPHQSHRNGQQVDIRPLRNDGQTGAPLTFRSNGYSRQATQQFVDLVRADSPGVAILFNDPQVSGVRRFSGHDNHLHISFSRVRAKYGMTDDQRAKSLAESPL